MSTSPIGPPSGPCRTPSPNGLCVSQDEREQQVNALMFSTVGDPGEVLRLEEIEEAKPAQDEVLLQMLFSPVNRSDLDDLFGDADHRAFVCLLPTGHSGKAES
jgi:hypothetical protein